MLSNIFLFRVKNIGYVFYTDDGHSNLIARKMEISDNVIPSSNSEKWQEIY